MGKYVPLETIMRLIDTKRDRKRDDGERREGEEEGVRDSVKLSHFFRGSMELLNWSLDGISRVLVGGRIKRGPPSITTSLERCAHGM
ncbi:hypothetical protein AVEN_148891-1 [Araneus ventricosus]|uniref:Uncharacterized protein n=1 Tax=Araneus ventricosus TaxID=182803 RepID=A0A4Y2DKW1_ARAVE|nr:hypothetical protein AVEN_148891-1 [Araneus ventricosus]